VSRLSILLAGSALFGVGAPAAAYPGLLGSLGGDTGIALTASDAVLDVLIPSGPLQGGSGVQDLEVKAVKVDGSFRHSEADILGYLQIRIGERYDASRVREGLRDLWRLAKVRVLELRVDAHPSGGVSVFVKVEEVRAVGSLEIRGNSEFERKELLDATGVTATSDLDDVTAERIRREIQRFYRDRGYLFAEVSLKKDYDKQRALYDVIEGPLVRVRSIEFRGANQVPASTFLGLGKHLTAATELHGKFLFFRGSEFSESKLRQDLVALRRYYRKEGYHDAVVECPTVQFSPDGSSVDLVVLIDEGRRYRVGKIDVTGMKAFSREEVLSKVLLKPGDPYTEDGVLRDFRAIQRFYGEHGFARHPTLRDSWQISEPVLTYHSDENDTVVDVVYEITENSPMKVRDVLVTGNRLTQDRVVRRALEFYPGDPVDQTAIERSILNLQALQYFEEASTRTNYRFIETPDPEWKDIEIEVTEGRTGNFALAGGISSNTGPFAGFTFTKRNFDLFHPPSSLDNAVAEIADSRAFTGAGQELFFSILPGLQKSNFDIRFTEPDLFGDHQQPWSFSSRIFYQIFLLPTNREDRLGESVSLGKSLDRHWFVDATIRNENIRLVDISETAPKLLFEQRGNSELRSVSLGAGYRDTDLPVEPTKGTTFQVDHESVGNVLGGNFDFQKSQFVFRQWFPLGENEDGHPHTLFAQARGGLAVPTGDQRNVPYSERFFLGGEGSLRGFRFRGAGPVYFGQPLGGEALYTLSLEYRFPLFAARMPGRDDEIEVLRGVFWNDWGGIGQRPHDPGLGDVRSGLGIGVRIRIPYLPQLPIAIHLGAPWLREKTDDSRILSFTVGIF